MNTFITKTGEVAYVPTESEKEIIRIALRQFQNSLSRTGEVGA
jgi:hypothetical protein